MESKTALQWAEQISERWTHTAEDVVEAMRKNNIGDESEWVWAEGNPYVRVYSDELDSRLVRVFSIDEKGNLRSTAGDSLTSIYYDGKEFPFVTFHRDTVVDYFTTEHNVFFVERGQLLLSGECIYVVEGLSGQTLILSLSEERQLEAFPLVIEDTAVSEFVETYDYASAGYMEAGGCKIIVYIEKGTQDCIACLVTAEGQLKEIYRMEDASK